MCVRVCVCVSVCVCVCVGGGGGLPTYRGCDMCLNVWLDVVFVLTPVFVRNVHGS